MGKKHRNGVDGAIDLLLTLADSDGQVGTGEMLRKTGMPRASLHRITRTLAAHGVLNIHRGIIGAGPLTADIVAHRRTQFDKIQQRRSTALRLPAYPLIRDTEHNSNLSPVALSAPAVKTGRKRFRIGFSNASMKNPWRTALVHAIEFGAARLGDTVDWLAVRHAEDDPLTQVRHIEELLDAGVDGLLVSTADVELVGKCLTAAVARGVTLVLVDRGLSTEVGQTSFVTSSNAVIGGTTALWLTEILNGEGRILLLPGQHDAEPARLRLAAAKKVFAACPGISIMDTQWTGWNAGNAYNSVSSILRDQAVDGVWCDSGLQGVGSLQAFIDQGGIGEPIPPHTGGDLNLAYKLAVRHEVPLAAVDYPPSMGLVAIETLHAALSGHWVPKFIDVQSDVIITKRHGTRSVAATLWAQDHVRWDLPDDLILQAGLGDSYNPRSFRIHYPGNSYNRSAAQLARAANSDSAFPTPAQPGPVRQ